MIVKKILLNMFYRNKNVIVVKILIFSSIIGPITCQTRTCTTPSNEGGYCVPAESCLFIKANLDAAPRPLPQSFASYLQRVSCGFENSQQIFCCARRHLAADFQITTDGGPPVFVTSSTARPTTTTTTTTTTGRPSSPIQIDTGTGSGEDFTGHANYNLLPTTTCGPVSQDRILGGNLTSVFEFPWMALLRYETTNGLRFQCGGAIINNRYILTAAHCVTALSRATLVSVRVGDHDLSTEIDCERFRNETVCAQPYEDIAIEQIDFHQNYNRPRFANDIALIRLARSMDLTKQNIKAICLPWTASIQNFRLARVTVAGWGFTDERRVQSNALLKVTVPVLRNDLCQEQFGANAILNSSQICAGGEVGTDTCQGDSGGPMMFPAPIRGVRYVQFGIVSAGASSCTVAANGRQLPGIYVRVASYMRWILDRLRA